MQEDCETETPQGSVATIKTMGDNMTTTIYLGIAIARVGPTCSLMHFAFLLIVVISFRVEERWKNHCPARTAARPPRGAAQDMMTLGEGGEGRAKPGEANEYGKQGFHQLGPSVVPFLRGST